MARRFNMIVVAVIVLAALLQSSEAQTAHVVGGTLGWTIPSSASAYTTWAATQTFAVGDILVFNFTTGVHDVAKVTKAAYDSCNSTSPISIATTGPTNITLDAGGEHYFICTFSGHCGIGQKLAINVSSAASNSPAPQPSSSTPAPSPAVSAPTPQPSSSSPPPSSAVSAPTPQPSASTPTTTSPASAPTPTPSRAPVVYEVLDSLGWTITSTGVVAYQTWASNKTFIVGDTLVFNFTTGVHDVAEVTKAVYDSCNITTTISKTTTGPARITLTTAGQHYYVCTFTGHCSAGQKLSITVTGTGTGSPATSPSSTTPSSPSPAGSTSPPPSPGNSAATSFDTAGVLSATFLSIAVALLY